MEQRFHLGDDCPQEGCDGRLGVLNTRVIGSERVRWIGCHACGWRPQNNKQVVPLAIAPLQRRRLRRLSPRRKSD